MTYTFIILITFFIMGLVVMMAINDNKLSMIATFLVWFIGGLLAYGLWR